MRSRFDNQLAELNRELIEMGAMCEESIGMAPRRWRKRWPGLTWR